MPLKSKSEWRWMAKNRPDLFKKWQEEAPVEFDSLPEKATEPDDGHTAMKHIMPKRRKKW